MEAIGFRYIANHRSKEIHRVDHLHKNCRIETMQHAGYNTAWRMRRLLNRRYNGCRWCFKEADNG